MDQQRGIVLIALTKLIQCRHPPWNGFSRSATFASAHLNLNAKSCAISVGYFFPFRTACSWRAAKSVYCFESLRSNIPSLCWFSVAAFCRLVKEWWNAYGTSNILWEISMLTSAKRKRDEISLLWLLPGIPEIPFSNEAVLARQILRKTSSVSAWKRHRMEGRFEALEAVPLTLSSIILDILNFWQIYQVSIVF